MTTGPAWCKRCEHATASIPCPRCDGPACAGCGRCPPCDGPVPVAAALEPPGPGVRCNGCGVLPDEQHAEECPERDPGPVWPGGGG